MAKFTWQDGTLVSKAKVEIDGTIYEVDPEEYSGATPLSASNLNTMQDGIYEDIGDMSELETSSTSDLVNAINSVLKKSNGLLYVRKTTDQQIPANNEQRILFDSVITNQGDCFSYSAGQATVLTDDVKAVTVTASVFNKGWGNLDGSIRIYKNSEIMANTFFNKSNEQVVASFAVQKNDVIRATVTSNNGTTISNSNNISFLSIKS